jgi:hypothetical protein
LAASGALYEAVPEEVVTELSASVAGAVGLGLELVLVFVFAHFLPKGE